MKYQEVKQEALQILKASKGKYLTVYQIFKRIEENYPQLYQKIVADYRPRVGKGSKRHHTPANYISLSLDYFKRNGEPGLSKEWLDPTDMVIQGIEPGYTGPWLALWAWKP